MERTQRELERERVKLEVQEKKLLNEIKRSVKNNQLSAAKIQAKDLVRTRNYINKFNNMKTQLQAISLRIQSVRSNDQMTKSMRDATGLLSMMNQAMNLPQLQKISMDFERQNDLMDQRQEFMDEAIDNVMEDDEMDEDEEAEQIFNEILDQVGIDLSTKLNTNYVPNNNLTVDNSNVISNDKEPIVELNEDDELQQRLNSLKR